MTTRTVGVVGASGYLGGELLRLLSSHPSLLLKQAVSQSHAGETLDRICPWLADGHALKLEPDASSLDVDLAFLALPQGEALRTAPSLRSRGIRVVDLGPDYRLKDPAAYEATYGRPHSDPDGLAQAVYGLPEIDRDAVRGAKLLANPGCYPTATLLALLPLAKKRLLPSHIVVDAKSGSSGAGASPTPATHHPLAGASVNPYGGGNHRHVPEIRQALSELSGVASGEGPQLTFVPHLVPVVRGLLCSIYAPGVESSSFSSWNPTLEAAYASEPFVRVGGIPRLPWAVGSNRCYLATEAAPPSGVLYSALDNLVKGGAGQAIQNANLMLGVPETDGLPAGGLGP
ncbi:MAG: N-acetyl-gamma-glutamyl-phosphate reductase [Euryarchaeota archaeon]|nr:N-acetyl-gamma-glutamyl-phosphate reductase [Euryarchaeota archaeon]MDE1835307.1 N-acetyl-gamma-glutamyl-phosphate reductase [Euryarchaeota archaeon]MDE1880578.1 N-acetyl-gamma-glutamyl-phosphate reductase [Euryarchaeota archaeon]MDE2043603.1 N-acetyl-gamma-glutamyl-phosphate reductase [Thermoplasmata archaeon]